MDRILQSQPATLMVDWERAGQPYDPGAGVTVTIVSDATGLPIVTNGATSGSPGTSRSYTLTPAQTAMLDKLIAVWTAADGSTLTTYTEITGDFYFSVAQARKRSPLQDTSSYSTQSIMDYRTLAEMAIEDICGVAFVPRYSHDIATIQGWGILSVPRRRVRKVRAIYTGTDTGPQALPTLAGLRIDNGGLLFMPSFWNWWSLPITVAYEHGDDYAPPRVSRAALELARRWLVESPWDERTTGFRTRDGGQMTILTARTTTTGVSHPFDIPEVAAIAEIYGTPMVA